MKVIIDGVEYAPLPRIAEGVKPEALDVRFDSDAGDNLTVREYFMKLLVQLWKEGEGFSGKRPFGNSGWEHDLYVPLVKAGFLDGDLDDDGYVDRLNYDEANSYIEGLIIAALSTGQESSNAS